MTSYTSFMTIPILIVIFHLFFFHTLSFKEHEHCFISLGIRYVLLLFDADERYLNFHSVLLSLHSDVGVPTRSLMARARTRLV